MTYSCDELGIKDEQVRQGYLKNAINDIIDNVVSGKRFEESISRQEAEITKDKADIQELDKREGKSFAEEDKLVSLRLVMRRRKMITCIVTLQRTNRHGWIPRRP